MGKRAEGRGEMRGMRRFRGECGGAWKSGRVAEVWGGVRKGVEEWEGCGAFGRSAEGAGGVGGLRRFLGECGGARRFGEACGRVWRNGRVVEV